MTDQPYEGATEEQLRSPMVREFLAIHSYFRDQLAAILRYTNELLAGEGALTAPETDQRTRALIQAGSQYTRYLHMHHHIETSRLFPALEREGMHPAIVDRLNGEHDEIAVLIDAFAGAVSQLSDMDPAVLGTDLRRLSDALTAHLAYEETHVCPLLARWQGWPTGVL